MPTADVSEDPPAPAARDPGAVGLIGLGEIGQVHAVAIRRSSSARLVAVADTSAELLRPFGAQGVRGYPTADELIADPEVGTVCVCLPHHRDQRTQDDAPPGPHLPHRGGPARRELPTLARPAVTGLGGQLPGLLPGDAELDASIEPGHLADRDG